MPVWFQVTGASRPYVGLTPGHYVGFGSDLAPGLVWLLDPFLALVMAFWPKLWLFGSAIWPQLWLFGPSYGYLAQVVAF